MRSDFGLFGHTVPHSTWLRSELRLFGSSPHRIRTTQWLHPYSPMLSSYNIHRQIRNCRPCPWMLTDRFYRMHSDFCQDGIRQLCRQEDTRPGRSAVKGLSANTPFCNIETLVCRCLIDLVGTHHEWVYLIIHPISMDDLLILTKPLVTDLCAVTGYCRFIFMMALLNELPCLDASRFLEYTPQQLRIRGDTEYKDWIVNRRPRVRRTWQSEK